MITKNFKIISRLNIEEHFKLNTIYQCFSIIKPYNDDVKSGSIEISDLHVFTRNILIECVNTISNEITHDSFHFNKEYGVPKLLIAIMNSLYEKDETTVGVWKCVKFNNGLFAKEAFLNVNEYNKHIDYIQEMEPYKTIKADKQLLSVERRLISLLTYLWDSLFNTKNFIILLNQYKKEKSNENANFFIRVSYNGVFIIMEGLVNE